MRGGTLAIRYAARRDAVAVWSPATVKPCRFPHRAWVEAEGLILDATAANWKALAGHPSDWALPARALVAVPLVDVRDRDEVTAGRRPEPNTARNCASTPSPPARRSGRSSRPAEDLLESITAFEKALDRPPDNA